MRLLVLSLGMMVHSLAMKCGESRRRPWWWLIQAIITASQHQEPECQAEHHSVPCICSSRQSHKPHYTTLTPNADQVQRLTEMPWKSRKVRLIFFGDYELICACYRLSGASGLRPCLFCLETKKERQQLPSAQPVLRSLESLQEDCSSFQADGAHLQQRHSPCHPTDSSAVGMHSGTTPRPGITTSGCSKR